jgi:LPS sulfotransferase NodH
MPCIIVAATPRCGSSYLSSLLQNTRAIGAVQEYAPEEDVLHWNNYHGFNRHWEYFESLREIHSAGAGRMSIKVMWWQMRSLLFDIRRYANLDGNDLSILDRYFGSVRFVYIKRTCPLLQSISLARAIRSGVWAKMADDAQSADQQQFAEYDAKAIRSAASDISLQEKGWREFFALYGVFPFMVRYEELIQRPRETVRDLLGWMNVEAVELDMSSIFLRQADAQTDGWKRRFQLEEMGCAWVERTWAVS